MNYDKTEMLRRAVKRQLDYLGCEHGEGRRLRAIKKKILLLKKDKRRSSKMKLATQERLQNWQRGRHG